MTSRRAAVIAAASMFVAVAGALLLFALPRWLDDPAPTTAVAPGTEPAEPSRTIKARLFYVSDDGTQLTGVERDVPFAEGNEQAREIINAQIAPATAPLVSAVPPGTVLRGLFITDQGDAYVDLSREAAAAHWGGTLNEMLTVYTIVHALTVNLPAVEAVQILIDGKEVPTLAGHVDLRQPLAENPALVQ
jgi:spore germination protein GerM